MTTLDDALRGKASQRLADIVPLRISLELTTCATPFSENGHEATFAMLAVPLTV